MDKDGSMSYNWVRLFFRFANCPDVELDVSDEILNGKTHDKNSNYFAKFCFEQGIELYVARSALPPLFATYRQETNRKRIEVIADDEDEMWGHS